MVVVVVEEEGLFIQNRPSEHAGVIVDLTVRTGPKRLRFFATNLQWSVSVLTV